jgi:ribosomal protein S2
MKVQQTSNKYQNKLLALKLIKTKIYKTGSSNSIKVEDVISRLKKVLYIIFRFHSKKKRILFIGNSTQTSIEIQKLFKKTKHLFIPEKAWVNGLIKNRSYSIKYRNYFYGTVKKKIAKLIAKTQKSIDLIILLNSTINASALNEGYVARFPIIALNCDLDIMNPKPNYKVPGNFYFTSKKLKNEFFYSLIAMIFKKVAKLSRPRITRYFFAKRPDRPRSRRKPF